MMGLTHVNVYDLVLQTTASRKPDARCVTCEFSESIAREGPESKDAAAAWMTSKRWHKDRQY